MTTAKAHHYAIDAAQLLETCLTRLRETIALDKRKRHEALIKMESALVTTERLLLAYICQQVDLEREAASNVVHLEEEDSSHNVPPTLPECIDIFQSVLNAKTSQKQQLQSRHGKIRPNGAHVSFVIGEPAVPSCLKGSCTSTDNHVLRQNGNSAAAVRPTFDHSRSPTDLLLFRLIVTLQLCLVRIDDARFVITGRLYPQIEHCTAEKSSRTSLVGIASTVCVIGSFWFLRSHKSFKSRPMDTRAILHLSGKVALVAFMGKVVVREWGVWWMTAKVVNSTADVEEWQQQWLLVQTTGTRRGSLVSPDAKSQRLIEYAMKQSPKSSLWHSEGEIRFLLLKRAMDLLYASVGTAVEATKSTTESNEGWTGWKTVAAAAAASYYSFFDPSKRASEAVSSSSLDLIQYAWGMVSLPAIKQLSLQASRLFKGAAIAERITIAGVPCFVLSRDPSPDLSAALMREKRRKRSKLQSDLSTIEEQSEFESSDTSLTSKQGTVPRKTYSKKDTILHLTGGGFFAHTIASDVPFLLDWSGKTNAIVICPEYSLLPENIFPVALNQVTKVYCSLISGSSSELLGVDADRVIVTGESAGGNLAVAMCVKLCIENLLSENITFNTAQNDGPLTNIEASNLTEGANNNVDSLSSMIRLPDAIMLSCPALNLTLDLSPSRVVGQQDPVLPSGLISAISDAYAPPALCISKKDPLVSPFYAPDEVLRLFPPILLFASSEDPLLDDSVDFNRRCRSLGVESVLGAVSHMPHAYWGLGTAGFPEARQVQHECEEWLVKQLERDTDDND